MVQTKRKGVLGDGGGGTPVHTTRSKSGDKNKKPSNKVDNSRSPFKFLDSDPDGKHPCKGCHKEVVDSCDAVQCDRCAAWLHQKCTDLKTDHYDFLASNPDVNFKWFCGPCIAEQESGPLGQADCMAKQGEKIDELLRVIGLMQTQMVSMQHQMNEMTELVTSTKKEEGDKRCEIGNQMQATVTEALEDKAEKEEKRNNIIMFRVPEPEVSDAKKEAEDDVEMVKEILGKIHPDIDSVDLNVKNVTRMGKSRRNGYTRPIKVQFQEDDSKGTVFRNSARLKTHTNFSKINLSNDKTKKELEADKKLKSELDRQRLLKPDDDLIIFRGDIIKRADRAARVEARAQANTKPNA